LLHPGFTEQEPHESALAAAEIGDRSGAGIAKSSHDGLHALLVEADGAFDRRFLGVVRSALGVGVLRIVVDFHEARECVPSEPAVVPEVAASDELPIGMRGQPFATSTQQLVDLFGADPVVLVVVEHRQQHEEVLSPHSGNIGSRTIGVASTA
jgi:hypothetical protein